MPSAADRGRSAVLFIAPVVFLAGALAHPFVRTYLDTSVVADAVSSAPNRWAVAHLTLAVGIGLMLLAVLVIRRRLREAGEERWSERGTTLVMLGGVLLAAVVGSEVTLAAVVTSGGDVLSVLEEVEAFSFPLFGVGVLLFVSGWLSFAVAFRRARPLPGTANRAAMVAMAAILIGFLLPQTSGTYIYGTALLGVCWLVGYEILTNGPRTHGSPPRA